MARMTTSEAWGRPTYLDRDARLPDMGASPVGPRPLRAEDVDAILACDDLAAVAELKAYAHSYFAIGGSVIGTAVATVCLSLARRPAGAIASAVAFGVTATVVMEARRRARQWEAIADARLAAGGAA
ncbi:hypothetical protein [Demequina activiva]|uniref:Uncharacterized protein n=1 Tax=Demequina activiva TaxID=1582364 RepID=A0A919Q285_9MICO|nr:hypothetical protein [Demequina activiva]GIG54694.1 hypothetical protein Dac01nite_14460 [Demequina activiva]